MFRHPKYYKELRKRNKLDQAISKEPATAGNQRSPGPGKELGEVQPWDREATPSSKLPDSTMVKQRALSSTSRDQELQAASYKRQATSFKQQASSVR